LATLIRLISDAPAITPTLVRVPDALIQYQFHAYVGKRCFTGPLVALRQTSHQGLLSRIHEYDRSSRVVEDLQNDIRQRLGYGLATVYRIGQEIDRRFSPSDRIELLNLQTAAHPRFEAESALAKELFRCDREFQQLGHLAESKSGARTSAYYVHRNGWIWSSQRTLTDTQWIALIDRKRGKDDVVLATLGAEVPSDSNQTRSISVEVRRAVWTRDQGKCAKCGSRERLEFDHIVPVSRGGSSTERNVELLCEVCNRAKSDSIM
jgi:hypothetical protein